MGLKDTWQPYYEHAIRTAMKLLVCCYGNRCDV